MYLQVEEKTPLYPGGEGDSCDDPSSVGDSSLVVEMDDPPSVGDSPLVEMDDPPSVVSEEDSPLVEGDSHHPPPS